MENYFPCSRFSSIKRGFCLPFSTNSPSYFTRRASVFAGPEGDITSLMGNMECLVPFPHQSLRKWHFPEYPHYTVCFFPMTSGKCRGQQVRWCEKKRISEYYFIFWGTVLCTFLFGRLPSEQWHKCRWRLCFFFASVAVDYASGFRQYYCFR